MTAILITTVWVLLFVLGVQPQQIAQFKTYNECAAEVVALGQAVTEKYIQDQNLKVVACVSHELKDIQSDVPASPSQKDSN